MQANAGGSEIPRPELARPQNMRGAGSLGRRWALCAPGDGWWWYSNSKREAAGAATATTPVRGRPKELQSLCVIRRGLLEARMRGARAPA